MRAHVIRFFLHLSFNRDKLLVPEVEKQKPTDFELDEEKCLTNLLVQEVEKRKPSDVELDDITAEKYPTNLLVQEMSSSDVDLDNITEEKCLTNDNENVEIVASK